LRVTFTPLKVTARTHTSQRQKTFSAKTQKLGNVRHGHAPNHLKQSERFQN
jgi:hypothetical protein